MGSARWDLQRCVNIAFWFLMPRFPSMSCGKASTLVAVELYLLFTCYFSGPPPHLFLCDKESPLYIVVATAAVLVPNLSRKYSPRDGVKSDFLFWKKFRLNRACVELLCSTRPHSCLPSLTNPHEFLCFSLQSICITLANSCHCHPFAEMAD